MELESFVDARVGVFNDLPKVKLVAGYGRRGESGFLGGEEECYLASPSTLSVYTHTARGVGLLSDAFLLSHKNLGNPYRELA